MEEEHEMPEENEPETQPSTENGGGSGEGEASGLRKQLSDALAENKALKGQVRTTAFKEAGFDPAAGNGKALAAVYSGEADADAIRQFALDEFGWEPTAPAEPAPDRAQQRQDGEGRLAQVAQGALPSRAPSDNDQLAEAEAKAKETGDWSEFNRLSAQKLEKARPAS